MIIKNQHKVQLLQPPFNRNFYSLFRNICFCNILLLHHILRNKFAKCTMMDLNSRRSNGKTSAKELSSRVDHIQCDQIFIQNCCGLFLGQLLGKLGYF